MAARDNTGMLKRSNTCKKAEKDLGLNKVDGYAMYF